MAGYEGSGNTVNIRGVRIFLSAKQIPAAGWFVRVGMPTEIAFAPIQKMNRFVTFIAIGLSLLCCLVAWLSIRYVLTPLSSASAHILRIVKGQLPLRSIPVIQRDEIGQLLTSFNTLINDRKQAEAALEDERRQLQQALDEVRTLRGILPICSYCKKVRDDKGYWNQVEQYVSDHTDAKFSHGICPSCYEKEMKKLDE
jgi:sensor histidine kinase YesM